MSSSESEDSTQIQIREREQGVEEYIKPQLLKEYEEEVAKENAELSSSDEEDEDEEESTMNPMSKRMKLLIINTQSAIRAKDPSVYDTKKKFFTDDDFKNQGGEKNKKRDKKVTLKDYERQVLLEHGGYIDEEKEIEKQVSNHHNQEEEGNNDLTHVEEQAQIKKAFQLAAANDSDSDSDNTDDDNLLVKRDKSKSELEKEEDDYRKFLLDNLKEDETSAEVFKEWDNIKDNPNVNPDDAFLMNYVLNRGWVDKKGKSNPTYDDIVNFSISKDEDEHYLEDVDRFESKYNFRYEEPGSTDIITHAREVPGSVRRKESKRKRQREKLKAKKQALKEQKLEELKRLKNEKRKEIHERLLEIQKITGTGVTGFENIDLEGDFDPEKYDEQMSKMFNDDYYEGTDQDNVKPIFDDLDDDFNYENDNNNNEEEDIMMDADYLPGGEKYEEQQNKKNKGKGKGKATDYGSTSDSFNNNNKDKNIKDKEYNKLMDEYYSLDFEDVIGDIATRYKYIQTEPEDYGMTAEEILLADDTELNKVIGVKSLAPYRNEYNRKSEYNTFNKNKKRSLRGLQRHVENKKRRFEQHNN
ncbi:unnamed protein product [Cunninghamella blakesleeana]